MARNESARSTFKMFKSFKLFTESERELCRINL